jgi:hypothetical protein
VIFGRMVVQGSRFGSYYCFSRAELEAGLGSPPAYGSAFRSVFAYNRSRVEVQPGHFSAAGSFFGGTQEYYQGNWGEVASHSYGNV